jgi:hypothetical protein
MPAIWAESPILMRVGVRAVFARMVLAVFVLVQNRNRLDLLVIEHVPVNSVVAGEPNPLQ